MSAEARGFERRLYGAAAAARLAFLAFWAWRGWGAAFPSDPYLATARAWLGWAEPIQSIWRPPLYPAALACVLFVFRGAATAAIPVLQCLLSAWAPVQLYRWARPKGEDAARLAGAWLAADPAALFFAPQLQTETLFLFLMLAFFERSEREGDGAAFGAGLLGGLASLTRGVFLAYAPFFAAASVLRGRARTVVLVVLGWAAVIAPWTLRNSIYYHAFIPISAQSGWNMYEGFSLDRDEIARRPYAMGEEIRALGLTDPLAVDKHFGDKLKAWIKEHPAEAARIVAVKAFRYWRPWPYDPYSPLERAALGLYFTALLGLAAFGAWSLRARARELAPVYALALALTILHSLYFTSLRYRLPLEPFLIYLASAGALRARRRA